MKKTTLLLFVCWLLAGRSYAQNAPPPDSVRLYLDNVFAHLNPAQVPTPYLEEYGFRFAPLRPRFFSFIHFTPHLPMKKGNRISETLSLADGKKIVDALHQVEALLPFLITLQPEESRSLRNIGFDGVPFADADLDATRASIDFTRRGFDLAEFEKDVALLDNLRGIQAVLAPLAQKVQDTYRLVGADVMVTADDVYEDLRKDNGETAAVQPALKIMKKRYAHRMGTAKTKSAPTPKD